MPALTPDANNNFNQVVPVLANTTTTHCVSGLHADSDPGDHFRPHLQRSPITAGVTPTDQAANGLAGATVTLTQTDQWRAPQTVGSACQDGGGRNLYHH